MNTDAKILKKILANWGSQKSEPVIGSSGGSNSERVSAASQNPAEVSLYPSPEDLKVDKMIQAQAAFSANPATPAFYPKPLILSLQMEISVLNYIQISLSNGPEFK